MARTIYAQVREIQELKAIPSNGDTYIMLFVDVVSVTRIRRQVEHQPLVRRTLLQTGIVEDASTVNDFLEGLNDHQTLNCVVDVAHGAPMWRKMNGA